MTEEQTETTDLKEKVEEIADSKDKVDEKTPTDTLSEITKNLEDLKKANDETEKELLRQEELRAKVAIGGRAIGAAQDETEEEKAVREAAKILEVYQ